MDDGPIVSIEDEDDPQTSPMARKYFDAGLAALDEGDIKEARRWLKLAHDSAPDNPDFQDAWQKVDQAGKAALEAWRAARRSSASSRAEEPGRGPSETAGSAAPPRAISLPVAVAVTLGLAVAVGLMLSRPRPEDHTEHAATYAQVADFTTLIVAPGGGWVGKLHEDWSELEEPDKLAHCEEIGTKLPPSGSGVLVLSSADGGTTVCPHRSEFPPGPEQQGEASPEEAPALEASTPSAEEPLSAEEPSSTEAAVPAD